MKYKILTNCTISSTCSKNGLVYRIEALKDFECQGRKVKAGDYGGYVESIYNLSQEGNCWIFSGRVFNNAVIQDNALVDRGAFVMDSSVVKDNAVVSGFKCFVKGSSIIGGNTVINNEDVENLVMPVQEDIYNLYNKITRLSKDDFQKLMSMIFDDGKEI